MKQRKMYTPHSNDLRSRILVIDDDREVVETIKLALESNGFEVITAHDGATGIALVQQSRPDLVILDMMLPKRSGFLVLETLRQFESIPTRVIMITANDGKRHREYAESLGVDGYLNKPFEISVLINMIHDLLDIN